MMNGTIRQTVCRLTCILIATAVVATPGRAALAESPDIRSLLSAMRAIVTAPVTTIVLRAQNEKHRNLTQTDIDALDKQWRAETKADRQPLIAQLMGSPLSAYLSRKKAESEGLYTEIFIADAKGLNAGQSSVTTDYWQGDEPKYLQTFAVGADAVHLAKAEIDPKTGTRRQQIDFTIVDPDTGAALGAATFEVDLDELIERQNRKPGG